MNLTCENGAVETAMLGHWTLSTMVAWQTKMGVEPRTWQGWTRSGTNIELTKIVILTNHFESTAMSPRVYGFVRKWGTPESHTVSVFFFPNLQFWFVDKSICRYSEIVCRLSFEGSCCTSYLHPLEVPKLETQLREAEVRLNGRGWNANFGHL